MMLLPNVPDFCTAHRDFAKVHQIIAARGTLLKKEECDGTKSGTVTLDSTSRHVNAPCGIMQNQCFFPLRGVLLFSMNWLRVFCRAEASRMGHDVWQPLHTRAVRSAKSGRRRGR